MSQFNNDRFERVACPICGRKFVNGNKLNRHKRTCEGRDE